MLLTLVVKLNIRVGLGMLNEHLVIVYLLIHCIGTVCLYKEWVPRSFLDYPKDVMQWQIMINFILCNAIPLIDFLITTFVMFPILIVSSYL